MSRSIAVRVARRRIGVVAGAVSVTLALMACGGGGGGSSEPGKTGEAVYYAGAVSLVDGRVGDSPFYDDGSSGGFADGRALLVDDGTPVTVEWRPTTRQLDQGPEAQLAGYRVYFGHKAGNYDYVIELGDPSAQSCRLAGLGGGTYYFAVSAVDGLNREGPLSSAASITVQ